MHFCQTGLFDTFNEPETERRSLNSTSSNTTVLNNCRGYGKICFSKEQFTVLMLWSILTDNW